ncbi:MAG: hypothetical protein H6711_34955 [Myxococcales bacterium]|nr:hypothetical protein [Myxococcales bacterium]
MRRLFLAAVPLVALSLVGCDRTTACSCYREEAGSIDNRCAEAAICDGAISVACVDYDRCFEAEGGLVVESTERLECALAAIRDGEDGTFTITSAGGESSLELSFELDGDALGRYRVTRLDLGGDVSDVERATRPAAATIDACAAAETPEDRLRCLVDALMATPTEKVCIDGGAIGGAAE